MGIGVFQQKEPKNAGAHKIGAAISGPRIAGGKLRTSGFFSDQGNGTVPALVSVRFMHKWFRFRFWRRSLCRKRG